MKSIVNFAIACFFVLGTVSFAMAADDKQPIYTTIEDAGADYQLQGEYKGFVEIENQKVPFGAQVIALGDGKFKTIGYPGGLPGAGWKRGMETKEGEGTAKDGKISIEVEGVVVTITKDLITVSNAGNQIGSLEKVVRKSPTLGAKPPADAVVLFDGKSAAEFVDGKIVQENLLLASTHSKRKFQDHTLHVEFRTPFKPHARGQGRGNSGVYVQGRYEVQVLDSFGLDGKSNECGGIYKVSEPIVNMCFPPLAWQTYDIDFTAAKYDDAGKKTENARITVKHNGVVIHEDLELPASTPGRHKESPAADELYLQGHGNPVVFRNIWVVEK